MQIPENIAFIIARLESAGYEAYAVGGCVRDRLLGCEPKDWDVCTSAEPESVKAAFPDVRILDTGIKHGTVTLLMGGGVEVTTFRVDGEYKDSRRPESVSFTASLRADLARRDLTINAMAYSPRAGLIDPFGGRRDLAEGVIRTVGRPEERFGEDALRILRALRFSVTLGFDIEPETEAAMLALRHTLGRISAERVRAELVKALTEGRVEPQFMRLREVVAEIIPELRPCFDFEQRTIHHCRDVYAHSLAAVDNCTSSEPTVKMALLLHDIMKPAMYKFKNGSAHFKGHPAAGAKKAAEIMRRLKFDNKSVALAEKLVRFHDVRLKGGLPQILKLTRLVGDDDMPRLFAVMRADTLAQSEYKRAEKLALIDAGEADFRYAVGHDLCRGLSGLAIGGADAAELGFAGRQIGAVLHFCLNAVMNGKIKNERAALLDCAEKLKARWADAENAGK